MMRYLIDGFDHSKTATLNLFLHIYLMLQIVICMKLTCNMKNILINTTPKY